MRVKPGYLFLLFLTGCGVSARSQDTLDLLPAHRGSLICWTDTRTNPRPLKIYYIRLDLTCPNLEVFTLTGEDPDGKGPAESALTPPKELFARYKPLAAVNANAFAVMPGTEKDIRGYYKSRPVDIQGMAVQYGKIVSAGEPGRTPFWIDHFRQPHIGDPRPGDSVLQAVSDWGSTLLLNDKIIPDPEDKLLHPRTAIGFDNSGKWLLLVVVDGRQPGFSEGISLYELAKLFQSKGCTQSINLDGGGSSIMLIQKPGGGIQTINRPSGQMDRPIPVMLGIR